METDALLIQVQNQCLEDPDGLFETLQQSLVELKAQPLASIEGLMRTLHGLKGNLQLAAFQYCSQYVHELESVLTDLSKGFEGLRFTEARSDRLFEMLAACLSQLEAYFSFLRNERIDAQEEFLQRVKVVHVFRDWLVELGTSSDGGQTLTPLESYTEAKPKSVKAPPATLVRDENRRVANPQKYLTCSDGSRAFAVHTDVVFEIIDSCYVNLFPWFTSTVKGLIVYRGEPLVILQPPDFVNKVDLGKRPICIIAKNSNGVFGFLVRSVDSIVTISPEEIQTPEVLSSLPERSWIHGIWQNAGKGTLVLNLSKAEVA